MELQPAAPRVRPSAADSDARRRSLLKAATGIVGLDEITDGGLPCGRPTLVCGTAGAGKTLLAMEFLVRGHRVRRARRVHAIRGDRRGAHVERSLVGLRPRRARRRIRWQAWGQDIFMIAVTGWGQAEDRRRTAEAGFDVHLVKPVNAARLMKLLDDQL